LVPRFCEQGRLVVSPWPAHLGRASRSYPGERSSRSLHAASQPRSRRLALLGKRKSRTLAPRGLGFRPALRRRSAPRTAAAAATALSAVGGQVPLQLPAGPDRLGSASAPTASLRPLSMARGPAPGRSVLQRAGQCGPQRQALWPLTEQAGRFHGRRAGGAWRRLRASNRSASWLCCSSWPWKQGAAPGPAQVAACRDLVLPRAWLPGSAGQGLGAIAQLARLRPAGCGPWRLRFGKPGRRRPRRSCRPLPASRAPQRGQVKGFPLAGRPGLGPAFHAAAKRGGNGPGSRLLQQRSPLPGSWRPSA